MPKSVTISKSPLFRWAPAYCTGGTLTIVGGKRIHTFLANDTLVVVNPGNVDYLVVAGGGGGSAGAGGAGGYRTGARNLTAGNKAITVGAGGAGVVAQNAQGGVGGDSIFDIITSAGGGGGGRNAAGEVGGNGGSGGGGGYGDATVGDEGTGIAGQGFDGGDSAAHHIAPFPSGGGGGAGALGGDSPNATTSGNGGPGLSSSISGAAVDYAGGGGGGVYQAAGGGTPGTATHGGGNGNSDAGNGVAGTANRGGGGGGAGNARTGGNGGSGIVIVSYDDSPGVMSTAGGAVDYTRNLRPSAGPSNALAEAGTFSNYSHKIRGLGGFWQCSFVWHDELSVLMEMMAEGWVRGILVMGERGMEVWEGFVAAMELSLTGGMPALKVTGYGYFRTLFWRVYNQTASGHVDAAISAEVVTIIAAVGQFIASTLVDSNISAVDRYHDADRFAGDLLFDMCAAGNALNRRSLIGCYENRQVRYQEIARYET